MEENKYNVDLASMDKIFDNKTFRYRINAFAYACKMDDVEVFKNIAIVNPYWLGTVGNPTSFYEEEHLNAGVIFSTRENKRTCEGTNYFIAVNKDDKGLFGKNVTISGYYNDLNFSFINYYDDKKIDKKIVDLPFKISLAKLIDNDNYKMDIETVNGVETKITFSKYREHKKRTNSYQHSFYVNMMDFSNVLKLVKAFVYNPDLVFRTYNEVIDRKKMIFTTMDMKKGIMQDANLDKPMGKVKKIVKRIINND